MAEKKAPQMSLPARAKKDSPKTVARKDYYWQGAATARPLAAADSSIADMMRAAEKKRLAEEKKRKEEMRAGFESSSGR